MIAAIRALFASRKFVLLIVGTVVAIGTRYGLELDTEVVALIVALFATSIGGIAYEDGQAKGAATISQPFTPSTFETLTAITSPTVTVGPADGGGT